GIEYSGLLFGPTANHALSHVQFVNCRDGIKNNFASRPVYLRNALFYNTTNIFTGDSTTTVYGEHLTVHDANWLNGSGPTYFITLKLTNSLLVSVTNTGSFSSNSVSTGTEADFQTVGTASHYLAANSSYRNTGITNINASLRADLKKKTTYPPVMLTNAILMDTT